MSERIAINKIRTDGGTQPRAGLDDETVTQYTESVKSNANFPPVVVYYDGSAYWLADGFHRLQAHKNAQKRAILADVRQGNLREAILHSAGANATHGLRRSNDDKRRAVMCLLDDPEWSQWSDRAIAKRCNVSQPFVSKLRPDTDNVISIERKFTHPKTGETSTMNTANIGKQAAQLIDNWLRSEYDTDDPARLASHARYSTNWMKLDKLRHYLRNNGANDEKSAVIAALTDLAAQYQGQVTALPETAVDTGTVPKLRNLLKLADTIDKLHPETKEQLHIIFHETWKNDCQDVSLSDYSNVMHLFNTIKELLP